MPSPLSTSHTTRQPAHRLAAAAARLLVSCGLLVACGAGPGPSVLDGLEQDIADTLADTYEAEGLTLFDLSCPRTGEDAGVGEVFACVADVERQFVRVRVEPTTGGGHDWATLDVVLLMETTEQLVAEQMSATLNDLIQLDCGSPALRVLPIGSSFRCTATDSGRNRVDALLTVNGPGQTSWELL